MDNEPSGRQSRAKPPHRAVSSSRKSRLTIDDVVRITSRTLFSPGVTVLVPIVAVLCSAEQSLRWNEVSWSGWQLKTATAGLRSVSHIARESKCLRWSLWYAGTVLTASLYSRLNYAYEQNVKPFHRPAPLKWEDQIVVVTGGGGGIGSRIALRAADRGARVVVLDVSETVFTAEERIATYRCDVSDRNAVMKVALKICQEVGAPTIVVNNAGVMNGKLILDLEEKDVMRTFGVNVISHFWVLQAFLPGMIAAGRGHVVNIASLLGITGNAQLTDYCASKAAVITMHDSLNYELKTHYHSPEIRTMLVLPSHVQTGLFSEIRFPSWGGLFPFIAPSLEPDDVAQAIIIKLDRRENGTLRLPLYSHLGRFMGLAAEILPGWARNFARWAVRSDTAMEHYRTKSG